ncbi:hypothetical protein B0H14DRAFT_3713195 [Mycena olivaceomarginata]|nr:hypothetical protein B0H14DRAFT_3713195 [Mycena olivaceomarginata]
MDAITGHVLFDYIAEALAHSDFQGTSHRNLGELCERHWCLCASPLKVVYYYRHFKNDNWRLKTLVWVPFFIDTVGLLNDYACVYLYTITHVGDTTYFADQNSTIPVYVFTTVAVALPVQIYLVTRYWKFTHKHVITLFLSLLILAGLGGSFTCGVMVALFPAFKDRSKFKVPAIIWLATEAAADLGIAAVLLWEVLRTRPTSTQTRNLVNRLVTVTLQTGTATATIAVASLVGYLLNVESNIGVAFAWCLGRLYVLTMLSNLNIRKSARIWTPSTSRAATSTTRSTSVVFAQPGTEMDTNLSGLSFLILVRCTPHNRGTHCEPAGPASWVDNDEEQHARSRKHNGHRDGPPLPEEGRRGVKFQYKIFRVVRESGNMIIGTNCGP